MLLVESVHVMLLKGKGVKRIHASKIRANTKSFHCYELVLHSSHMV